MSQDFSQLPYRICVGIALFNQKNEVWVGRRLPKWDGDTSQTMWQMPQGGIDEGETPEEAARRELFEETGVSSAAIIAEAKQWFYYDLPEELLGTALKGRYCGQKQKWFAMRFLGDESEIDIEEKPGHKAEFSEWRWASLSEVPQLIVPFKRKVYEQVVNEFRQIGTETG